MRLSVSALVSATRGVLVAVDQKTCWCSRLHLHRCAGAQMVEGIVLDVGWYRTTIRSFEREIYNIPNSVFSRNVVLNITRKNKEWRFYEFIGAPLAG